MKLLIDELESREKSIFTSIGSYFGVKRFVWEWHHKRKWKRKVTQVVPSENRPRLLSLTREMPLLREKFNSCVTEAWINVESFRHNLAIQICCLVINFEYLRLRNWIVLTWSILSCDIVWYEKSCCHRHKKCLTDFTMMYAMFCWSAYSNKSANVKLNDARSSVGDENVTF